MIIYCLECEGDFMFYLLKKINTLLHFQVL